MTRDTNKLIKRLHHTFSFIAIVGSLIYISAVLYNDFDQLRIKMVNLKESKKFDQILLRKLEFQEDKEKICKRASKKLQNYYKTGDEKEILKEDGFKSESREGQPEYIINYLIL